MPRRASLTGMEPTQQTATTRTRVELQFSPGGGIADVAMAVLTFGFVVMLILSIVSFVALPFVLLVKLILV